MTAHRSPAIRHRVALYSHDTQGLGHIRRNSLIAHALTEREPGVDVMLLSGAREAACLPLPPRTEVVLLPTVFKDPDRGYAPGDWSGTLADTVQVRSAIIEAAVAAFAPDVFVVDKVPLGVGGELLPTLRALSSTGETALVLGLRDVLDAPEVAVREWVDSASTAVVDRYYDELWVYGDRGVYDPVTEYALPPSVAAKARFTGYLSQGRRPARPLTAAPATPYVLCLVGGGQDGIGLAEAFAHAPLPPGVHGVVVTGPYMPAGAQASVRAAARHRDLTVLTFARDVVSLIERARAVVTMGGYNSVCEVLAARRPALVVPRRHPRAEQLVRAQRLSELGLVDLLPPPVTAEALARWMADAVLAPDPVRPEGVDLSGLARVARLLAARFADHAAAPQEVTGVPA